MGVGPNMVLDKGMLATGGIAYRRATLLVATGTPSSADGQAVALATGVSTLAPYVVCMEDVDAIRVSTLKVMVNCRLMGIARVKVSPGVNIPIHSRIIPDANGLATVQSKAAAGAQPALVAGIAMKSVTAAQATAGMELELFITPGATW